MPGQHRPSLFVDSFCLVMAMLLAIGCGGTNSNQQQEEVTQEDPEGEFEWGMTRLKRALRLSRPGISDGLVTKRDVEYELIPPSGKNSNYSARVTVVSATSFLHGKRKIKKKEKEETAKEEPKLDDPLANKEDFAEYLDIPGTGSRTPAVATAPIDTRSLDSKSVFEMVYTEGKWKLTQQPKLKHEQLWFEYAFE